MELRQMIEKQLNKLESSNKFGKAVFHGNNQEFQYSTKEEQLIADGCKRLIENAIICWNYTPIHIYRKRCMMPVLRQKRKTLFTSSKVVLWSSGNISTCRVSMIFLMRC